MSDYIVTDTELTSIADAIRTKGGTQADLVFPTGFVTAIGNISGGGGTDTSDATLTSGDQMLSGYTAYSKGTKYTGNIATKTDLNLSASGATVTVPSGYYAQQYTKNVSSGSTTAPATISGSSATVSTGTNTLTLSKTVSVTPSVTAGYISSGTATNSSVSLQASVTTKGSATITPTTTDQTISSGTYLTGTQTIKGDSNLVAGNIKSGTTIFNILGTYSGGGGGLHVDTKTTTPSSASASISFTGLSAEPTSFAISSRGNLATGASPYKTAGVVYDGTSTIGQYITNTNNAQMTYSSSAFSYTYSSGTLTVTGTDSNFQANEYDLVYTYGGGADTETVQVGSGATSITFTGLEDEPAYWSCMFTSNIGTSSGYSRAHFVVFDGTDIYGNEMSSGSNATTNWTASYSNGSLTITSNSTSAGGYFHQPGYYQLTYAIDSNGNYQSKTVTPSASEQTITADSQYDALKRVIVEGDADLVASNIKAGVSIFNILGTYSAGGGSSIDTKTTTNNDNTATSLSFTSMKGTPIAWFLRLTSQVSSSGSTTYYYVVDMRYNGSNTTGNCFRMGSTRRVDNVTSGYSYSYSGTTLTISSSGSRTASPGSFYNGGYELVYIY